MERLAVERCKSIDKWLETAMSYENKGDLDLARECLLVYHYISKKNENSKEHIDYTSISKELEGIESKILLKLSQKIPVHHTQLFFPSILSVDPTVSEVYLPGQIINAIKPLATVTRMEVDNVKDNYLSACCGMCGKFCVTKSPTVRIPGVSILLGRRIICQNNCGITYCSDFCHMQHSALHGDLCQILPEFYQHILQLGLCKYKGLLGLKTLANNAIKLKCLLERKIQVKSLEIPILGDLSQLLFNVTNKNLEILYTRQEVIQLFTIIYSRAIVCNISDIPIDLPFFALIKCKIWVFSPDLLDYVVDDTTNTTGIELLTSWQNGKVYLRASSESEVAESKFHIRNYEVDLEGENTTFDDYRCRFCIVGFCKNGVCKSCGNYHFDEVSADPSASNSGIEDNLMFLMSNFGYDSSKLLCKLLWYIDSKQLGPFSYSRNVIKFLIRSALCLSDRSTSFELKLLSHILGKLAKLLSIDGLNDNLLHIATLAAYSFYKLHGKSCLGVVEMREIASTCNVNWINHPLKFSVSDSALLDSVVKRIYGPSTFTSFPPDCHSSIVNLAFAASRTLIPPNDPLFESVRSFVLEFEKLGVVHFPTGLTPLGLALMSRNDSLLTTLGNSNDDDNSNDNGSSNDNSGQSDCKYTFDKTPTPLIVTLLKFDMNLSDSKGNPAYISKHLHKIVNLIGDKKEFVDSRTSEIEGFDTAMHYAAWSDNLSLIKILLKYGAISNPLSGLGLTPFDLAASAGNLTTVKYFIENVKCAVSTTSLFLAACSLEVSMLSYLIELCKNSKILSIDDLPKHFGLVWHGIAFSICQPNLNGFDLNNNNNVIISRLNDAVDVIKLLCDWGYRGISVLDGKLPSESVKSLSLKFLEGISLAADEIQYASIAHSFVYLGQLFENIEKNM